VTLEGGALHRDVARLFVRTLTLILTPICPHLCDHLWVNVLKEGPCVLAAGWPTLDAPDFALQRAASFVEMLAARLRGTIAKKEALPKKAKRAGFKGLGSRECGRGEK